VERERERERERESYLFVEYNGIRYMATMQLQASILHEYLQIGQLGLLSFGRNDIDGTKQLLAELVTRQTFDTVGRARHGVECVALFKQLVLVAREIRVHMGPLLDQPSRCEILDDLGLAGAEFLFTNSNSISKW
jgi:hypothetical protein